MKSFIKKFSLILLTLVSVLSAKAQPFVDIVTTKVQQYGTKENTTTESTNSLFLPIEVKNENYVIVGFSYGKLNFQNSETTLPINGLTVVSTQLGGIRKWNDTWSSAILIIGQASSDFEELSGKDYQIGGAALMIKSVNEKFKYKFGMFYNRHFFGNLFVPLFGFELEVSDRLQFFGILPGTMNLEYKLSDKFYAGIEINSKTSTYRLSEKLANNYIREGHAELKASINYYPLKRIVIYGEIGHSLFRRFKIFEDGTKNEISDFTGFKDKLFLNIGASFRVRVDGE